MENGELKGLPGADPRITAFKGIPFAAPPVGKNRWKAPQPCENWEGVRTAYEFGPISMQDTPGLGDDVYCRDWHVDPEIPNSEDCLYLNVWTPAKTADEKLPVLVWIYGGGFQWGYTAEMEFDGERLARKGIVVVTLAYRLGAFGFMSHPQITAESPEAPGNFGLLDQKAGLDWVRRNIASFGGDPDKITIAGQSAGGGSVMHQLTCEENFSKIKGAVVLSGMIRHPDETLDIFKPLDLTQAEKKGEEFLSFLGVQNLEEARQIPAEELLARYGEYAAAHSRMFPIRDGVFCKGDPMTRFVEGKCAPVPVISGNTSDEFIEDQVSLVETSVKRAFLEAEEKGSSQKFYYYRFDPDMPGWDKPGTFHSSDLWFFFETLGKCWRPFTGRHYDLARQMSDYFVSFVKTQDPNGMGSDGNRLPVWKPYTAEEKAEMLFLGGGAKPHKEGGIRLGDTGRKQAVNPYLPSWEYIPDGEPYVFGDRVYVYGSHDRFGGQTFCLGDYVCWSAPVSDLGNWQYEGVIYPKTDDPMNPDGHMCLYAPDVTVGPDGRYYLFYVLDKVCVVSVAVCDTPAGRYRFLGYVHYPDGTRLGEKEGDEPQFDPGVLTEGDETYLYTGFCGQGDKSRHGAMLTVLEPDMLTIRRGPRFVAPGNCYSQGTGFEGHAFFEAPSIRKWKDLYYFVYSSEVMHELCYAVGEKPEGPFRYGGVISSNCDLHISSYKQPEISSAYGGNNHGSIIQINDDWYIFYHRHTNDTWFSRQGCAEILTIEEDGTIRQAEMTSCGLNGGPLRDRGEYPAYIVCNLMDEKDCASPGAVYVKESAPMVVQDGADDDRVDGYITKIRDGVTAAFKYFAMENAVGVRIWTKGYYHGKLEVRTTSGGPVIGVIEGDGSNIWTEHSCRFDAVSGTYPLYLTYRGEGSFSLRSFEILHEADL